MKKVLVIGGGPAGMMAAITAAEGSNEVFLIEKKEDLGKKLLLTGKGRCNLTNVCGLDEFIARFIPQGNFLRDAFKSFFTKELMDFFERRGLSLKVERQKRVFPVTDKASSVLQVLKKELKAQKVKVLYESSVKHILVKEGKIEGLVLTNKQYYPADRIIVATGGLSYPQTGSSGEGFTFCEALGHKISRLAPALVPMETVETFPKEVMGLTLKNIRLTVTCGKKKLVSDIGELLFTDFGVSGPLILSMSGLIVKMLSKGEVLLAIDLKPALDMDQLQKRLLREFQENPRMLIKNVMKNFLPVKLAPVFLKHAGIDPNKNVSHISVEERKQIIQGLKSFCLKLKGPRPIKFAMVTQGGISLKEVNPRTMESRLIKGLYFAGEILDLAGDTGGFNLQAAFSTGYLAGKSASASLGGGHS